MSKKSFLLYIDSLDILDHLSDEQSGKLFKAIKAYSQGEEPQLNAILTIAFIPIKNQIDRDIEKYTRICERNKVNGIKGGRPRKPKKPTGLSGNPKNPSEPKKAHTDTDTDTDTDIIKKKKRNTSKPKAIRPDDVPEQVWDDYLSLRKTKRAPVTPTSVNGIIKQAKIAGITTGEAMAICCDRGWQSFNAGWDWQITESAGKVDYLSGVLNA